MSKNRKKKMWKERRRKIDKGGKNRRGKGYALEEVIFCEVVKGGPKTPCGHWRANGAARKDKKRRECIKMGSPFEGCWGRGDSQKQQQQPRVPRTRLKAQALKPPADKPRKNKD